MEEVEDTWQPFWHENGSADHRRLRRSYSLFFSSGALLMFLLVTAVALVFIIAPTLHSFTSNILKPHSVKKSWDSLNFVLVLFAILCGFLGRNNNTNEETPRSYEQDQNFNVSDASQDYAKPNPETPLHWDKSYGRLRSFNSYPDLRQQSSWVAADERWRFYDDTHVNRYRGLDLDDEDHHRRSRQVAGEDEVVVKNIQVDTFVDVPSASSRDKDVRRSTRGRYQAVGQVKNRDLGAESLQPQPSTPPPTPPPPPLPAETTEKIKNKRGSATREFLTSLKGKKKKKPTQKSFENFESILNSKPHTMPSQPPPPPPPPPPPSVFHGLFSSKKSKHKNRASVWPPPSVSSSKTKLVKEGMATRPSNKSDSFYTSDENVVAGNESPLIPIPAPPPPPPFNMPAWKFKVQGDYVRIDSIGSSSSGSPDLDEFGDSPTSQVSHCNGTYGGEPEILLFYPSPSPDVDTKADTFIENFRAGLRMEKMNSTKEKQGLGRSKSNLGPHHT